MVCLVLLVPLLIFDVSDLSYDVINSIGLSLNVLVMVLFFVTFFYLNFKMTGVMMDNRLNEAVRRIYKVQLILLVSRAFMVAFEVLVMVYVDRSFEEKIEELSKDIEYEIILGVIFVGSVLYLLLTEGLPIMYSFRSSVVLALSLVPTVPEFNKESIFTGIS